MNETYRISFLLLMFFLTCSKKSESGGIIKDDSYLPLAVGNYWEYKEYPPYEKSGHEIRIMKVIDTTRIKDTLFYKVMVEYSHTGDKLVWFLYKDSKGNTWMKDSLKAPSSLYQRKITEGLDYLHYPYESDDSFRVTYVSGDTIEVPAGIFECLKIKLTFFDDTTTPYYMWHSKGIGLVKGWIGIGDINEGGEVLIKARVSGVKYP